MADFSKVCIVVCPTLCVSPLSDVLGDVDAYGLSHVVSEVSTIIGHFKAEKAIIGGHDSGGAAMQMLTVTVPDMVEGLILIYTPSLPWFYNLVNWTKSNRKYSLVR
jgi:pimeloyl-ACP methyl ester carboxylesterase